MFDAEIADDRANHWIRENRQCRIPKRWIAFDTEAVTVKGDGEQTQTWAMGCAIFWRRGVKRGNEREDHTFETPEDMWRRIASYCRPGTRTVAIAHNLGYDVRISRVLEILPTLGFQLEWCNLDRNVSSMSWKSPNGTLVLCDLFTWIPKPLRDIGQLCGTPKLNMPKVSASADEWRKYCLRDCEIVHVAYSLILDWIEREQLGNWQPTGAGMAYATWRHKFMEHKVLVHNNPDVIAAERAAMHTGRAEAWRHGILADDMWHEIDMRTAYTRIAAETELPAKYKFSTGPITQRQYEQTSTRYRLNCLVDVDTNVPVAPTFHNGRTIWPVGKFRTWLWDVEINELYAQDASVKILRANAYTKAPVLAKWAGWVLSVQDSTASDIPDVVKAYAKHSGRALIGRLSLRAPKWEPYGENPMGEAGISYEVEHGTLRTRRMMHVGNSTFVETGRVEGRDSLPQITGCVMAECRVRLFWAMQSAGFDNIAHVDTDSVIVNSQGLRAMQVAYGAAWRTMWQRKGSWASLDVYGPRNLRTGSRRKIAGVPLKATETKRDTFTGEQWHSLASDMANWRAGTVTITDGEWTVKRIDPRRLDASGADTRTVAVRLPVD